MHVITNINDALKKVSVAIPKETGMDMLKIVHFKTYDSTIKMTATDLESVITVSVSADIKKQGEACIDYQQLFHIINTSKGDTDIFVKNGKAHINNGIGNYEIQAFGTADYPTIPKTNDFVFDSIDINTLQNALNKVAHAVGANDNKYVLSTISLNDGDIVATDGYRLSISYCQGLNVNGLVKDKFVSAIKMLNGEIQIGDSDNKIAVVGDGIVMVFNKVMGYYPSYRSVLPANTPYVINCDKKALIEAIRAVLIDTDTFYVYLHARGGDLLVSQQNQTKGSIANATIPCESNNEIKVNLSYKYLLDVLNVLDSNTVNIKIQEHEKGSLVLSAVVIEDNNSKHVIMPVRGN